MTRAGSIGVGAGVVAPALFAFVVVALTVHERSFLDASGWSAIHRSRVEWPSLLALGPAGWLMTATFVVVGILGLLFSLAIDRRLPEGRAVAVLVALLSIAVALETFSADAPTATASSWHARIHNTVYPAVPLAAITAAALLGRALSRVGGYRRLSRLSVVAALLMIAAAVAAFDPGVAQLARFVLFGALLAWLEFCAVGALRAASQLDPVPNSARTPAG